MNDTDPNGLELEVQKIGPGAPALGPKITPGVTEAVTGQVTAIYLSLQCRD